MIWPIFVLACVTEAFVVGQAALPQFEVASVRASPSAQALSGGNAPPGLKENVFGLLEAGTLMSRTLHPDPLVSLRRVEMRVIVGLAFTEIRGDEYLRGAPAWINSDDFDLIAEAPSGSSTDDIRLMIQSLLVERFHLAFHRDMEKHTIFAVVVDKRGAKLQPAAENGEPQCRVILLAPPNRRLECRNVTMEFFVDKMANSARTGPTLDRTGLQGKYDIDLDWSLPTGMPYNAPEVPAERLALVAEALSNQLGLKLETRKEAIPVIVIDHLDRVPTEN